MINRAASKQIQKRHPENIRKAPPPTHPKKKSMQNTLILQYFNFLSFRNNNKFHQHTHNTMLISDVNGNSEKGYFTTVQHVYIQAIDLKR